MNRLNKNYVKQFSLDEEKKKIIRASTDVPAGKLQREYSEPKR